MENTTTKSITSIGCVVKAKFPGVKDECSVCGVLINPDQGIILSHGSLLTDVCLSDKKLLAKIKDGKLITNVDLDGSRFESAVDSCWRLRSKASIQMTSAEILVEKISEQPTNQSFTPLRCNFIGAFRNADFDNLVRKLMPNKWSFADAAQGKSLTERINGNSSDLDADEKNIQLNLLSYFVLLRCNPINHQSERLASSTAHFSPSRHNNIAKSKPKFSVGSEAEIISTPFAGLNLSVFFNSYSKGVISNVSGPHDCWILTDTRCLPGCEGGPLFTQGENGERQLAGVVVAAPWVGLTVACGIESIFFTLTSSIRNTLELKLLNGMEAEAVSKSSLSNSQQRGVFTSQKSWMSRVVLVQVGRVWGSGVVVDTRSGVILTCSHVIKDASPPQHPIMVRTNNTRKMFRASVVYRQSGSEISPYDIAVIKCPEAMRYISPLGRINMSAAVVGQPVWMCGHAIFNTELEASLTAGVVSKVICLKEQNVMVQSTSTVHAGASGGPLLDSGGSLLGIMVCNTVDKGSNSTYPDVNFSIPATAFWPAVEHYIKTGDASRMQSFRVNDALIKKLWALDTSIDSELLSKSRL